ncbi:MAG: hypothetical protein AAB458_01920 [Patescibacteria group bacterium]
MHTKNRRRVKMLIFGAGLIALLLYSYYEFRGFLYGPELILLTPLAGETVTTPTIDVTGTTQRIVKITLNGSPIFVDEEGAFSETVSVLEGYNLFVVSVEDRFGNVAQESREVIYTPEATPQYYIEALPRSPSPIDEIASSTAPIDS